MTAWAEDEEIVCVHPGGTRLVGYDAVRAGWEQLFAGDARLTFRLAHGVSIETAGLAMRSRAREPRQRRHAARRRDLHQCLPAHALRLAHGDAPRLARADAAVDGAQRRVALRGKNAPIGASRKITNLARAPMRLL